MTTPNNSVEGRVVLPFTGIVNQERLKLALILNAINPRIGGVLVRGAKGTGKSTTVRALADLLPEVEVVTDCPFNCNPRDPTNMCDVCRSRANNQEMQRARRKMRVVELPIGATEDRVVGTLDIEKALREGVKALETGILAEANQGVLYVDETNLLPDHIADVILDAAASGWNIVEREGISVKHPSRFMLVGTMNPEEGELRPQLLDRMALHVEVGTILNPTMRVAVMKANLEFEDDPFGFRKKHTERQDKLRGKILKARETQHTVRIPDYLFETTAQMCINLKVDGHRPDIIIMKAARALAAYNGREEAIPHDVVECASLTLGHRTRNLGVEPPASENQINDEFEKAVKLNRPSTGGNDG